MSAEGIKMAAECWLNLGFKVTIVGIQDLIWKWSSEAI